MQAIMQAIMQATPQPPVLAHADELPQAKTPTVTVFTDAGSQTLHIPKTHDEMMGLITQRRQLNQQLDQITDRRNDIIEQLRSAPEPAQQGLQNELNVLDARIIQIQNDLGTIGREISQAAPALMAMAEESPNSNSDDFDNGVGAGVAGTVTVMSVLFFFSWRWWKRGARRRAPMMLTADSERLQRLEQGIDAMAIEIERISEGQRFVTKLLSETRSPESVSR